jgi:hypothetical protein
MDARSSSEDPILLAGPISPRTRDLGSLSSEKVVCVYKNSRMTRCFVVPVIVRSMSDECWDGQLGCYVCTDCESRTIKTRLESRSLSVSQMLQGHFTKLEACMGWVLAAGLGAYRSVAVNCCQLLSLAATCHFYFPCKAGPPRPLPSTSLVLLPASASITSRGRSAFLPKLQLPLALGCKCCSPCEALRSQKCRGT